VRSKYDVIVQSLPSDYEKTLQAVQDHLTDHQICDVLTSPNCSIANKIILNCLIEKVKCTANVLEFCDELEKITVLLPDPGILAAVVNELRMGKLSPIQVIGRYFKVINKLVIAIFTAILYSRHLS